MGSASIPLAPIPTRHPALHIVTTAEPRPASRSSTMMDASEETGAGGGAPDGPEETMRTARRSGDDGRNGASLAAASVNLDGRIGRI
jgi:hypothetical protein